tara:strand:+ start:3153 stop:3596 length:444 start_codon:yes stop_codon:yes gene_type:complete
MNKNYIDYIIILSIFGAVVLVIISYYTFYISKFYDKINNDILSTRLPFISDYWALSHIILFFIVTYLFPKRYIFITICGIIWEIIEYCMNDIIFIIYNKNILNDKLSEKVDIYIKNINPDKWWYGRPEDIIYNGIGTTIALLVRNLK